MRSPLLRVAVLALALSPLSPGLALGAAFSADPTGDPDQIVLDAGRGPVLLVSAIDREVESDGPLFLPEPPPRAAQAPPPLVLLESPEEILARHYRNQPRARIAGLLRSDTRFLDALLILCSPFAIPLMLRRRSVAVDWPDEDEELASPM